jgi:hypothetical protein
VRANDFSTRLNVAPNRAGQGALGARHEVKIGDEAERAGGHLGLSIRINVYSCATMQETELMRFTRPVNSSSGRSRLCSARRRNHLGTPAVEELVDAAVFL